MKRINNAISKRITVIILAVVVTVAAMGCSAPKKDAAEETPAGDSTTIAQTDEQEKTPEATSEAADESTDSEKEEKIVTYTSEDGNWKISYDTEKYFLNDTLGDGEICFNYIGECSGTMAVTVSYHKEQMPDEVLYEKTEDIDDSRIERGECAFGQDMYWSHYRHIKPENEDPEKGDVMHEGFTAIEHNGGTILLDFVDHLETNEAWYSNKINDQSELINTFELLNHEPQKEYAYIPGKYIHKFSEEIEGDVIEVENIVILKEDHSCEITFQDTVYGEWTGTQIILGDGSELEFTVEGDELYLNESDNWISFTKEEN